MTREKTGGRQSGTPNKATSDARKAIAAFVEGNAHRLTEWLDQVADGVKIEKEDEKTGEIKTEYVVPPNPGKAFDMFQSVIEYHIPKLARTEVSAEIDAKLDADLHVNVFGELLDNMLMQRQSEE
jgi:hypothetical protein